MKDFFGTVLPDGLNVPDDGFIYYGFTRPTGGDFFEALPEEYKFDSHCRRNFIKETLIAHFKNVGYLVKPFVTGLDFSIFEKKSTFNAEWSVYRRIDFLLKENRSELVFNIGSENTLISENNQPCNNSKLKVFDPADGYIKNQSHAITVGDLRIVANREKRLELGISNEAPQKFNYNQCYSALVKFYNEVLIPFKSECFFFEAGGLKNVDPIDLHRVTVPENLMVFGNGKTEVNAITGMRDHGPLKPSPKAETNKFIFIYENSDDANKLYFHFKNGLKHFPGLFSYVGIPITLERDISLKYSNTQQLKGEFDALVAEKLPEAEYFNYFVIVIGDFNKQETDEEHSEIYYHIKNVLLQKGIPSQFIGFKGIRGGSFHYFLPNIAVAMLAKLGGIPWKLKSKAYDELVIGFNQKKVGENKFIGSAVFFSNEGELGSVNGYPESTSESALLRHLKNSIETYIASRNIPPERLVIHYYKPNSNDEKRSIEKLIQDDLRLNIPFAIVEINDSKSQIDIAFDQDFNLGMPESGTYLKVGRDEYLLFNNTRYQSSPVRSVVDELPIKVKIHFADSGGFSHRELISQIYEFSRLYWKGLKQKSQPVTTLYSKMIAEFEAHTENGIPDNDITKQTPWFL